MNDLSLNDIYNSLRERFEDLSISLCSNSIDIVCPCDDISNVQIRDDKSEYTLIIGEAHHAHYYKDYKEEGEAHCDTEKLLELLIRFIEGNIVVCYSKYYSMMYPVGSEIYYDEEEQYWPHGKPEDMRVNWFGRIQQGESHN